MNNLEKLELCLIDDEGQRQQLLGNLIQAGYGSTIKCNSDAFIEQVIDRKKYDAVLMDVQDFKWRLVLKVCDAAKIPVIFITNSKKLDIFDFPCRDCIYFDVVSGSEFNYAELQWRLSALLARAPRTKDFELPANGYSWGDYRFINGARTVVHHKGVEIPLQRRQFIFALALFQNVGTVISRDHMARCFGESPKLGSRSMDVCAVNVRKKLQLSEQNGLILRAVYGRGYQLVSLPGNRISATMA